MLKSVVVLQQNFCVVTRVVVDETQQLSSELEIHAARSIGAWK
jgi:hypothetical protein